MIRLNPVKVGEESVTRGLFPKQKDLATFVRSEEFKEILDTDAITEEGERKIAKYFNVETKWISLLEDYEEQDGKTTLSGFKRYFELLFLVKSESKRDEVWFSFFEGMHRHAAIVAGLLCSKFNHMTNELKLGSLTLKDFSGDTVLKSYKDPGISVEDHLNKIMTKQLDPPMFTNTFHLSAYIPKHVIGDKQDATTFITGAIYQSTWISNFKRSSATTTLSKNLSKWLETTQQHSTKHTRNCSGYRPLLGEGHDMLLQKETSVSTFKTAISKFEQKDWVAYKYPDCLRGPAWDGYVGNPFDITARKDFVMTISFPCMDPTKQTTMTPPYGISLESVTTDVGKIDTGGVRKVDARHYNGYLLIPGLVYHMSSKIKNIRINELYGNEFEVGIINYIARYGPYTRLKPFVKLHGAVSNYVEMTEVAYINECTGEFQIIPVTIFLVTLYNACWMFQRNRESNMLIIALDTFDLGDAVEHEKFMKTLSESTYLRHFPNWNSPVKKIVVYTTILLNIGVFVQNEYKQMQYHGILLTRHT